MRNRIRHNYPSLIHCLQAFHILFFAYLLFRCYCYNYYKNPKTFVFTVASATLIIIPLLLLNTLLQILSYPGVVELTTQLLILKNILWLPLCRINKFGLYFTLESCCDPLHLWVINGVADVGGRRRVGGEGVLGFVLARISLSQKLRGGLLSNDKSRALTLSSHQFMV